MNQKELRDKYQYELYTKNLYIQRLQGKIKHLKSIIKELRKKGASK